ANNSGSGHDNHNDYKQKSRISGWCKRLVFIHFDDNSPIKLRYVPPRRHYFYMPVVNARAISAASSGCPLYRESVLVSGHHSPFERGFRIVPAGSKEQNLIP